MSPVRTEKGVDIWIVNDALERAGGHLTVEVMTFAGKGLSKVAREVSVPANTSRRVLRISEKRLDLTDPAECVLVAELDAGKLTLSRSTLLFEKPRRIRFPEPHIRANVSRIDPQNFWLSLVSDVFVKDLFLDFADLAVELTDNYLDLLPGREELIAAYCQSPITAAALRKALTIRWMT